MRIATFIITLFLLVGLLSSCDKNGYYQGNDAVLSFDQDTLTFDTVFTSVGTITRYLRVYNNSKQDLLIDKISIVEGDASPFRINVDGVSVTGSEIEDVEILAEDYIYIFVEAVLGENNANDPLIILSELQYAYNNNVQSSYLRAWGQDAYFHFGEILENEDVIWQNDKPHVVVRNSNFPGVGVDSFSRLTILPGCKVYAGAGAGIFVDGELIVGASGNMDSVTFESSKIEDLPNGLDFDEISGLWYGIVLLGGSNAEFYNTRIRQATYGIMARFILGDYSTFGSGPPTILLDKVVVSQCSQNAVIALNANVTARNCLFHSAGDHLVALVLGGDYLFDQCTMYNSGGFGLGHDKEVLAISNFASNGSSAAIGDLDRAEFNNCIVYGTLQDELILNNEDLGDFNYEFNNCLVRTQLNTDTSFNNCIINENPEFIDASNFDFGLEALSLCIDAGADLSASISDDLKFNIRTLPYDIGALEYLP